MYNDITADCTGSAFAPRAGTEAHMNTSLGYSFFEIVKSNTRLPPTLQEFEAYFDAPGTLKAGHSLLTIEQDYVARMSDIVMGDLDVTGKHAVITGCSSGMGFALAVEWARRGGVVDCNGRDARIYQWHVDAASSDGNDVYVTSKALGTLAEAQIAAGLPESDDDATLLAHYASIGVSEPTYRGAYMLPMTHYPMYSSQIGIDASVFDRITFSQTDIRNLTAMAEWMDTIRSKTDTIDLLCFNAQTETGATMQSAALRDEYDDASQLLLSREQFIETYPNRSSAEPIPRFSNVYEAESVPWTIHLVFDRFGYENVMANTTVQLVSSIAATRARRFEQTVNGITVSSNGPSPGWFEYRMAKYKNEMHAELLKTGGIRATIISPSVFSTYINIGWLFFYSGRNDMPFMGAIEKKGDGKFYYPMTASDIHQMQVDLMMNAKKKAHWAQAGGYVGGGAYGGVQYMAIWNIDRFKNTQHLKMIHLSNPAQEGTSFIGGGIGDFGPPWDDRMYENSYCWDYANPMQSTQWLSRFKVNNDFSAYAEAWADISLHYIFRAAN